jgi:hypothetical protein
VAVAARAFQPPPAASGGYGGYGFPAASDGYGGYGFPAAAYGG